MTGYEYGHKKPDAIEAGQGAVERELGVSGAAQGPGDGPIDRHEGLGGAERVHEGHGVIDDLGIVDEEGGDLAGKDDEDETHRAHQDDCKPRRDPSGLAREFGIAGAESLPHQRGGGGGEAESGKERKREDSDADKVGGHLLFPIRCDEGDIGDESELDDELLDGGGIADPQYPP